MEETSGSSASAGTEIAWRALGEGPPLVLVNGYAGAKEGWDPRFLECLGSHSRVICTDNRGIGASPAGTAAATVEQLALDTLAVLDDLGVERAAVAGWSMGGFVAQTLAAGHPERLEAALLLATDPGGALSVSCEREVFLRLIDESGTPAERASRLIRLLFPDPPASLIEREQGDLVAAAQAALDSAALAGQKELMAAWHRAPSGERLAAIAAAGVPVLCAHGDADVVIPAANTATLAERLPGSWRATFPGAGHAFMAMEPERTAALVGAFLGR